MSAFEIISNARGELLSHEDADSFEMGGVFIKVMELKKGQSVVTHSHEYEHAHILGKGSILLEVGSVKYIYDAPAVIRIEAHKHHGITALEDSVGFCVHNTSEIEATEYKGS